MGHFFSQNSSGYQTKKRSLRNVVLILSPNYLGGKAKFRSGPDPHLLMKLDPIRIREKTLDPGPIRIRSESVATSAIDLTDNLIVFEQ